MTQKELLYFEDAIGHEDSIVKICQDMINNFQDENLISFINSEIEIHKSLREKLNSLLEEKVNG